MDQFTNADGTIRKESVHKDGKGLPFVTNGAINMRWFDGAEIGELTTAIGIIKVLAKLHHADKQHIGRGDSDDEDDELVEIRDDTGKVVKRVKKIADNDFMFGGVQVDKGDINIYTILDALAKANRRHRASMTDEKGVTLPVVIRWPVPHRLVIAATRELTRKFEGVNKKIDARALTWVQKNREDAMYRLEDIMKMQYPSQLRMYVGEPKAHELVDINMVEAFTSSLEHRRIQGFKNAEGKFIRDRFKKITDKVPAQAHFVVVETTMTPNAENIERGTIGAYTRSGAMAVYDARELVIKHADRELGRAERFVSFDDALGSSSATSTKRSSSTQIVKQKHTEGSAASALMRNGLPSMWIDKVHDPYISLTLKDARSNYRRYRIEMVNEVARNREDEAVKKRRRIRAERAGISNYHDDMTMTESQRDRFLKVRDWGPDGELSRDEIYRPRQWNDIRYRPSYKHRGHPEGSENPNYSHRWEDGVHVYLSNRFQSADGIVKVGNVQLTSAATNKRKNEITNTTTNKRQRRSSMGESDSY